MFELNVVLHWDRRELLKIALAAAVAPELLVTVRELKLLLQSALLCTTPEIAREGMTYVRKADAIIARAEGRS